MTNPKDDLRTAYDAKAATRDKEPQPWKVAMRQSFLERIQNANAQTLLELGPGAGHDSLWFQEQGFDVACIDLSPELVKLCQQKGLNARVLAFDELDYAPNSFDAVYALNSLLHVPKADLPGILQNIQSILTDGGHFFMAVWGGPNTEQNWKDDPYDPPRFFAFYPDDVIESILSKYFTILSFERVEVPRQQLHMQSIIMQKLTNK